MNMIDWPSVGVIIGVIMGITLLLRRKERKSPGTVAPEPIIFTFNGRPCSEPHITEDLLGDAMNASGQECVALLAAMQKHADQCPQCHQEHGLGIRAVRLL